MVCQFVAAIFKVVFGALTEYTLAPVIDAITRDKSRSGQLVVAAIITIVCGYFQDALSFIAVAITVIVTIEIGFDNGFVIEFTLYCPCGGARIITINGEYFGVGINHFNFAACILSPNTILNTHQWPLATTKK